jgi:hypothetical protein
MGPSSERPRGSTSTIIIPRGPSTIDSTSQGRDAVAGERERERERGGVASVSWFSHAPLTQVVDPTLRRRRPVWNDPTAVMPRLLTEACSLLGGARWTWRRRHEDAARQAEERIGKRARRHHCCRRRRLVVKDRSRHVGSIGRPKPSVGAGRGELASFVSARPSPPRRILCPLSPNFVGTRPSPPASGRRLPTGERGPPVGPADRSAWCETSRPGSDPKGRAGRGHLIPSPRNEAGSHTAVSGILGPELAIYSAEAVSCDRTDIVNKLYCKCYFLLL